jgi:prepilin-type N-terminal cleavage/methylation domain-containing protein
MRFAITPPPDAILSSVSKLFKECCSTKRFKNKHNTNHIQNKVLAHNLKAFTLAEVLITLVIIGIIAAITVPQLKTMAENQEYISAYKKLYSSLCQFHSALKRDNGGYFDGLFSDLDTTISTFKKYYNTAKVCEKDVTDTLCFPTYTNKSGYASSSNTAYTPANEKSLILSDGAILIFDLFSSNCTRSGELKSAIGCVRIRADINGWKKPNQVGKDIFDFYISEDKIILRGDPLTTTAINDSYGWGNGYKILKTGKI